MTKIEVLDVFFINLKYLRALYIKIYTNLYFSMCPHGTIHGALVFKSEYITHTHYSFKRVWNLIMALKDAIAKSCETKLKLLTKLSKLVKRKRIERLCMFLERACMLVFVVFVESELIE